jgi:glutaredoxin
MLAEWLQIRFIRKDLRRPKEPIVSTGLVMYMTNWCPSCLSARDALKEWGVPYRAINIRSDREAAARVRAWTGFESVPTLVIVEGDGVEPAAPPMPLEAGRSPAGLDRGSLLTEPNRTQLRAWLVEHGFITR